LNAKVNNVPDQTLPGQNHAVFNQPQPLENYNLYGADRALRDSVKLGGAAWAEPDLVDHGAWAGRSETIALGFQANQSSPVLHTHDRFGHRRDTVDFHPAYHELMNRAVRGGMHSSPWTDPKPGAHVARAAKFFIQSQVEAAHCCPITMTFAAVPALLKQPSLAKQWLPGITSREYDPRNIPSEQKSGLTIGMAMTEKQGGSDVRANTTIAQALGVGGPGELYALTGHKWFMSAPMCDAFLVLAQAPAGLTCFLMPRWQPDGVKNPVHLQRLKNKMGNLANASSEVELDGAQAWMVGAEGRGVSTIIEMVAVTRFDCMIGSAGGMRQATAQALHHCNQRKAFGALLIDQPLMQNVLADLALESEAATALTMRIARALDHPGSREEKLLLRLATAVGKYWICKRTPNHAYEAMECLGGNGLMEDCIMPRLFRESPVNSIWEGSGNVQCLDVLRALKKEPESLEVFFSELALAKGADARFDRFVTTLEHEFSGSGAKEAQARNLVDRMALALQGSLLLRNSPPAIADAFCAGRLAASGGLNTGNLPAGTDFRSIIQRALPEG
tara:strand:- start:3077 stop:4756 length:1680 start_codon:yes stop_codon:yes gene_type:complete